MEARALILASLYNRLGSIEAALQRRGWDTDACQEPRSALEKLRSGGYAAVFCDEFLKGASPSGFLAWSRRLAPRRPFYLFCMDAAKVTFAGRYRPDRLLAFPPDPASLPAPSHLSDPGIDSHGGQVPLEGNTALVPLTDLIEMLGLAGQSAVIALDGGQRGTLHLQRGALVSAVSHPVPAAPALLWQDAAADGSAPPPDPAPASGSGSTVGVRALAELVTDEGVDYQVLPFEPPPRKTIHLPTATAVTEAMRLVDEQARDRDLLDRVRRAFPAVEAAAVGYVLAQAPNLAFGPGSDELFALATGLLERNRDALGKLTHLSLEADLGAVALLRYGESNLLIARAPRGKSMVLLGTLVKLMRTR